MGATSSVIECLVLPLYLALTLHLLRWTSMSPAFVQRSLKPSKVWAMSSVVRSCLKLLRHMAANSCCVNFYGHIKVSPLHLAMKSVTLSFSFAFASINYGTPTRFLGLVEWLNEFMFQSLTTEDEILLETCIPNEACFIE